MSEFDPFEAMRARDGAAEPPASFGESLYESVRHSLDQSAVGAPPPPAVEPRRGILVAVLALGSVLLMAGILSWLAPADEPRAAVEPLPLSEPDDSTTSIVEHNPDPGVVSPTSTTIASQVAEQNLGGYQFGGWNVLPASEFDARRGAAVAWTGEQLIVWGGESPGEGRRPDSGWPTTNDGGIYDPGTGIWLSLPPAPLSARTDAAGLWTGSELLVLGGTTGTDGAAYDPATRLWRTLPAHEVPWDPVAIWTGEEAILWGGNPRLEGHTGVAYDPSTDVWRDIADSSIRTWLVEPDQGVWTGDEMFVWNWNLRSQLDLTAYNPNSDSWRRFDVPLDQFDLSQATGVWTGSEVVIWGANFEQYAREGRYEGEPFFAGIAIDPVTGQIRIIDVPPFQDAEQVEGFGIHSSVWVGDRMLVWAGRTFLSATGPELWAYDPTSDTWERGATSPLPGEDPELIWTGDSLYAYGGDYTSPLVRLLSLALGPGARLPQPVGAGSTLNLPVAVPFEILALEPFVQSAFVADFSVGAGRSYEHSDTLLQRDSIDNVAPLWDGWMTSANGEVWWFRGALSQQPFVLQNEPETTNGAVGFSYFLAARGDDQYTDRIWTVVPGDGFTDPDARSIVRSISVESGRVRTYSEAPPDAFPAAASTTGLLLNSFDWLDTGDGFVEDSATFTMTLVQPDGRLQPLWPGFGIDLSDDRIVWTECDDAGVECAIVVSSLSGPSPTDLRIEVPGFTVSQGGVASPDGRRLAVGVGAQGSLNQSILIVDLADGSHQTLITGRNLSNAFAPSLTWSANSEWVLSLDGDPLAARLADGRQVDLAEWIPEGMVIYAVASR